MRNLRSDRNVDEKLLDKEKAKEGMAQFRTKELLENPVQYQQSVAMNKAKNRQTKSNSRQGRHRIFLESVKHGPIYGCACCHRSCFENGVISLKSSFKEDMESCYPGLFSKSIGKFSHVKKVSGKYHLCFTCKNYLVKGKVPPMSHKNSLEIFEITEYPELLLTELENCMIARNLIFMKIFKLPKSRMAAVKDRIVNVPINEEDIKKTLKSLPRTPTEAGIIPVKLKRKQNFKNTHMEEYISVSKIKAALRTLKKLGHKYYQFIKDADLDSFEERCATSDVDGYEFLFGTEESEEEINTTKDKQNSDKKNS